MGITKFDIRGITYMKVELIALQKMYVRAMVEILSDMLISSSVVCLC